MKKIKVVYGNIHTIEDKVNELLEKGYILRGNMFIDGDNDFIQVLIKTIK